MLVFYIRFLATFNGLPRCGCLSFAWWCPNAQLNKRSSYQQCSCPWLTSTAASWFGHLVSTPSWLRTAGCSNNSNQL